MGEIRVSYDMTAFPAMDAAIYTVAGRTSDFSGAGSFRRDHGWVCNSDIEIHRIARGLKRLGLKPEIRR